MPVWGEAIFSEPEDLGTQGPKLACTVHACMHGCLQSLHWNIYWSSRMGYRSNTQLCSYLPGNPLIASSGLHWVSFMHPPRGQRSHSCLRSSMDAILYISIALLIQETLRMSDRVEREESSYNKGTIYRLQNPQSIPLEKSVFQSNDQRHMYFVCTHTGYANSGLGHGSSDPLNIASSIWHLGPLEVYH